MSKDFGNQFIRKPQPGAPAGSGLPSRPAVLPSKPAVLPPKPAAPAPAPEPKKFQVKPGPIRVEIKKPSAPVDTVPVVSAQPGKASPMARRLNQKPTFSKVFRWRLPDGQPAQPATVEVAGTFNHWQKVPLQHEGAMSTWHVTIPNITGHRTHHYMIFVDGKPVADENADGTAIPHGPQEEAAALTTARGPRVFMLFAQSR